MPLKILQKSQENTFVRVSFLIKLQALGLQLYQKLLRRCLLFCQFCEIFKSLFFNKVAGFRPTTLLKTLTQVFSCEFCEIFKNTFFTEHLRVTACKLWDIHSSNNSFGVRGSSYLYWLDNGRSKEKEKQPCFGN